MEKRNSQFYEYNKNFENPGSSKLDQKLFLEKVIQIDN